LEVNNITIVEQWKLLVELQIKTDFPISKSSVAIYEPGFIAGNDKLSIDKY
jgi:phospholipid/cholesterol/gamma-HCH transport system substrate-binding protein